MGGAGRRRGEAGPAVLHARLLAAPAARPARTPALPAGVTLALVAVLGALNTQIKALAASIGTQTSAHPHATRILARAWAHVIWRSWQDHAPYDPAAHSSLQTLLRQQHPTATRPGQG
jgi:hypothetical protein